MSDRISEAGRAERLAQWDKIGVERIKHDLLNGGLKLVGGTQEVQDLAREWVQLRENEEQKSPAKADEVLTLKPNLYGVGIDLKALGRKMRGWFKR
jgi:hypothetical protein